MNINFTEATFLLDVKYFSHGRVTRLQDTGNMLMDPTPQIIFFSQCTCKLECLNLIY